MAQLTIQELERATGILRDTLRVWERRYGFPAPSRNIYGERLYDQQTVERLLMITKLLDAGYRIGKLATLSREGLLALIPTPTHHVSQDVDRLLEIIRCLKPGLVYDELMQLKERFGVRHFIYELIAPLTQAVGEAWFQGRIGVLEEHTYSEQAVQILKEIVHQTPVSTDKKILMATLPGEQHVVGLLMASCVCLLKDLECCMLVLKRLWTILYGGRLAQGAAVLAFPVPPMATAVSLPNSWFGHDGCSPQK